MLSRLLAFAALAISGSDAGAPAGGYQCWNWGSTDDIRYQYLTVVNNLRKSIAEGTALCKDQTCPRGKNVYRLDWDCLLEVEAQKAADQCVEKPNLPPGVSALVKKRQRDENHYFRVQLTSCNPNPLFKETVKSWWDVVRNLAHGQATRIGCAQKNCKGDLYIACMLYPE
ncbi:SCP-like protein [Ancylostoma ceylanicum]|uniref:SCP-like protein n=1 Tax=Ancylostoma ceylanicum TaxID=53326 RepID=A0A0D6LIX5_9BILA|nr:SCP-like protein [Ancylostoma ceylanicum]